MCLGTHQHETLHTTIRNKQWGSITVYMCTYTCVVYMCCVQVLRTCAHTLNLRLSQSIDYNDENNI